MRAAMEPSRYRLEYAAYCSARARALYESYVGATDEPRLEQLRDRYADLWTRDAILELERAREATPATFETERAALHALASAARLGYADSQAREVADELSRCEAASRVERGGGRPSLRAARSHAAAETDDAARRELAARWLEGVRACDDLRAARLGRLGAAARELGFDSYAALKSSATNTDGEKLSAAADTLRARTAAVYESRISRWAARETRGVGAHAHDLADELAFARVARLDRFFPAPSARAAFGATMSGLGVKVGRQTNLRVEGLAKGVGAFAADDAESADANVNASTVFGDARTFGVEPPADVRLAFCARAGAGFCRKFFFEAGRAEHFAWASREEAARRPEFVHAPDRATNAGFASLLRALFAERAWLADVLGARPSDAEEIARACALTELYEVRRACARSRDESELLAADDPRSESLLARCAARRREATGFSLPTALVLFESSEDVSFETGGASASELLRGRLFAASLGEHLRTRHGSRWWARGAAGDELIDLWNTASRYSVEELAPLAGAGGLDAELLAETLIRQVS
ncbi:MAG: hypothetical protein LC746_11160 [Acidobacteria bacterium]|nr:hypothetical protein [Acidobacteriota bacterium]